MVYMVVKVNSILRINSDNIVFLFQIFLQDSCIENKQSQVFRGKKLVVYNFREIFFGKITWINSLLIPLYCNHGKHGEHDGHWHVKHGGYSGHTW